MAGSIAYMMYRVNCFAQAAVSAVFNSALLAVGTFLYVQRGLKMQVLCC